jgi:hypothetical protein
MLSAVPTFMAVLHPQALSNDPPMARPRQPVRIAQDEEPRGFTEQRRRAG